MDWKAFSEMRQYIELHVAFKVAQASFNASKWRSYSKDRPHNVVSCISNIVVPNETRIIAEQDTVIIVT